MAPRLPCMMQTPQQIHDAAKENASTWLAIVNRPVAPTARGYRLQATALGMLAQRLDELEARDNENPA